MISETVYNFLDYQIVYSGVPHRILASKNTLVLFRRISLFIRNCLEI